VRSVPRLQNSRTFGPELDAFQHPSEVQHFQRLPFRRGKSSSLLTAVTLPDTISLNEIVTLSDNSPVMRDC
jgi:hypothetical protein